MSSMSIASVLTNRLHGKIVIVGVGNIDCADDGTGVRLAESLPCTQALRPIIVGNSPEFHLLDIIREAPDVAMFVDAVDLGNPPGSAALIEKDQLSDGWGNGHQPPLSVIMKYVSQETGADIFLLAIQPEDVSSGNALSAPVAGAVRALSECITEIAANNQSAAGGVTR